MWGGGRELGEDYHPVSLYDPCNGQIHLLMYQNRWQTPLAAPCQWSPCPHSHPRNESAMNGRAAAVIAYPSFPPLSNQPARTVGDTSSHHVPVGLESTETSLALLSNVGFLRPVLQCHTVTRLTPICSANPILVSSRSSIISLSFR